MAAASTRRPIVGMIRFNFTQWQRNDCALVRLRAHAHTTANGSHSFFQRFPPSFSRSDSSFIPFHSGSQTAFTRPQMPKVAHQIEFNSQSCRRLKCHIVSLYIQYIYFLFFSLLLCDYMFEMVLITRFFLSLFSG